MTPPCVHHLVVLSTDISEALAVRTAAGWVLPFQDKKPHQELPDQIQAALQRMTTAPDLIHEAPLGPLIDAATDEFYFLAVVSGTTRAAGPTPVPIAELLSTHALIPRQREALLDAIGRARTPVAPFDTRVQIAEALDWAHREIGASPDTRVISTDLHRCARYELVARLRTTAGLVYFKAGPERVEDEATVTQWLASLSSDRLPATLAVDRTHHRWLYHELAGDLLVGPLLTPGTAIEAARALAGLQKKALAADMTGTRLANRRMNATAMFSRASTLIEDAFMATASPDPVDRWRAHRSEVADACAALDALGLPMTLVPSDFWGRNIVRSPSGRIGFIDLEQAYWSCPWLPLWRFRHDILRSGVVASPEYACRQMERAFIVEWADVVSPAAMEEALAHLPLLGRLFAILLVSRDCDVRERELGRGLPAWYRPRQLTPFLRRLVDSFTANADP